MGILNSLGQSKDWPFLRAGAVFGAGRMPLGQRRKKEKVKSVLWDRASDILGLQKESGGFIMGIVLAAIFAICYVPVGVIFSLARQYGGYDHRR